MTRKGRTTTSAVRCHESHDIEVTAPPSPSALPMASPQKPRDWRRLKRKAPQRGDNLDSPGIDEMSPEDSPTSCRTEIHNGMFKHTHSLALPCDDHAAAQDDAQSLRQFPQCAILVNPQGGLSPQADVLSPRLNGFSPRHDSITAEALELRPPLNLLHSTSLPMDEHADANGRIDHTPCDMAGLLADTTVVFSNSGMLISDSLTNGMSNHASYTSLGTVPLKPLLLG